MRPSTRPTPVEDDVNSIHLEQDGDSFSYDLVADGNCFSIVEHDHDRADGRTKTVSIGREQHDRIMATPVITRFIAAQRAFIAARKNRAQSGDSYFSTRQSSPARDKNEQRR